MRRIELGPYFLVLLFGGAVFGASPEPGEELSGGETTVFQDGHNAFAMPLANISRENRRAHVVGNSFFNKNWVIAPSSTDARDGLGPLFHARSCSGCHLRDGRGRPPVGGELMTSILFRLSVPGKGAHGGPLPDPSFGGQLGVRAIPGAEPEGDVRIEYEEVPGKYPDGTPYSLRRPTYTLLPSGAYPEPSADILMSARVAPPVHGLGLLEAIPEEAVRALADPEDKDDDGVSGRTNTVWNPEKGRHELGRFGWKSNQPDLRQQTAGAFLGDIGITSPIRPGEDITALQKPALGALENGGSPELDENLLARVVRYQQTLAPPARRGWERPEVLRGKELFDEVGCAKCHTPEFETGDRVAEVPELAGQKIRPYTDLLLHDMGEELADGRPDFEATGNEWRTPPLWGIGLTEVVSGHSFFLHDGRARGLEEAILWHGGEGEASRDAFKALGKEEREALLAFLGSL